MLIHECIDGRCPPDIDLVKEIGLTPLEKRAIFFCLQNEIEKTRKSVQNKSPIMFLLKNS